MQSLDTASHRFEAPQLYFTDLQADVAASLVAASADIAWVLDAQGVIRDLSLGRAAVAELGELRQWVGRRWVETVTVESRPKITAMLAAAAGSTSGDAAQVGGERQVTHPLGGARDLPVSYSLVSLGTQGRQVAIGRDLRAVAAVQQRLVDAQQSMERDYLRLRHAEARYRLLFEAVSEAVLVVDAMSLTVVEHNPAAQRLFVDPGRRIIGRSFNDLLAPASQPVAQARFTEVRSNGRADDLEVQLDRGAADSVTMSACLFRQDSTSLMLVQLVRGQPDAAGARHGPESRGLLSVVNAMPDAFVLTDMQGRILSANEAFSTLVQVHGTEALRGQPLDRWLGRSSVDLNVLVANLRQHGSLRLFPTTMRAQSGEPHTVEISAVAVPDAPQPCLGFSIRDVSRRLPDERNSVRQMPRSADQLTGLVGRLPLKDIVGETTDLIERMCIEAALELTRDNRASAAEMLGLSRQSLYVKMRRFGIQDKGDSDAAGGSAPAPGVA